MKSKKIVLSLIITVFASTLFADIYGTQTFKKDDGERKKAPKRTVKTFEKVKKDDLKYVDKSESSKMHIYDPITKKPVEAEKKKEFLPTTEGGKRFKSMGCIMCHNLDSSKLGPSVPKLAKVYKGEEERLIKYLKRDPKTKPMIGSERAAVMNSQLTKLRILSDEQYEDLSKFILSGSK